VLHVCVCACLYTSFSNQYQCETLNMIILASSLSTDRLDQHVAEDRRSLFANDGLATLKARRTLGVPVCRHIRRTRPKFSLHYVITS
jgi:hypothetical protein